MSALLIIVILSIFLLPIFSTLIVLSLIEKFTLPDIVLYYTLFLYTIAIVVSYIILKILIKYLENVKTLKGLIPTLKKINIYVILSVVIIFNVITIGMNIYQRFYKNDFPFNFEYDKNNYNITILSICKSDGNLLIFTEGDELSCDTKITSKSNYNFVLDEIVTYDSTYYKHEILLNISNISKYLERGFYLENGYSLENIEFKIPVTSPVLHHMYLSFKFNCILCPKDIKPNSYIMINSSMKNYMPATRDIYENIKNQRSAVLVLIFSVGIVSVLTSVKNLKDIIEPKQTS
jgi:hypothetical protein